LRSSDRGWPMPPAAPRTATLESCERRVHVSRGHDGEFRGFVVVGLGSALFREEEVGLHREPRLRRPGAGQRQ